MVPHLVIVDVVSRAAVLESPEALVKDGALGRMLGTSGEG
jgi:hypothetical protein